LSNSEPILSVRDLRTEFVLDAGIVHAVDGVSFDLHRGETLAIVGESGCGKSVTALSIMRLIPNPPGRITGGQVFFEGQDLMQFPPGEMQKVRGARISMIFQEPMTSLNPVLTIGDQVAEPLQLHMGMNRNSSRIRAVELLEMVGIPDPHSRVSDYPHQLSGGQRQRVMIAMALSCKPLVLIADEATTALDVTIQAQILELLMRLSEETGTATIIITHNLGIVARYADRVNVMYAGKIREQGSAVDIYRESRHPYTVGLLNSVPRLDSVIQDRLESIEGEIPDLLRLPSGCAFQDRCAWFVDRCANDDPGLISVGEDHKSACWEWEKVSPRSLSAGAMD
jgi:oligopeptide transport system ATP-binding protein